MPSKALMKYRRNDARRGYNERERALLSMRAVIISK